MHTRYAEITVCLRSLVNVRPSWRILDHHYYQGVTVAPLTNYFGINLNDREIAEKGLTIVILSATMSNSVEHLYDAADQQHSHHCFEIQYSFDLACSLKSTATEL